MDQHAGLNKKGRTKVVAIRVCNRTSFSPSRASHGRIIIILKYLKEDTYILEYSSNNIVAIFCRHMSGRQSRHQLTSCRNFINNTLFHLFLDQQFSTFRKSTNNFNKNRNIELQTFDSQENFKRIIVLTLILQYSYSLKNVRCISCIMDFYYTGCIPVSVFL